jgi:hypothetical protein
LLAAIQSACGGGTSTSIQAPPTFQSGGLLIITFDEGNQADISHGGGQVPTLIIASNVKPGFQSQTFYQHQSTLRLILASSGVNTFPGLAATAPNMYGIYLPAIESRRHSLSFLCQRPALGIVRSIR